MIMRTGGAVLMMSTNPPAQVQ